MPDPSKPLIELISDVLIGRLEAIKQSAGYWTDVAKVETEYEALNTPENRKAVLLLGDESIGDRTTGSSAADMRVTRSQPFAIVLFVVGTHTQRQVWRAGADLVRAIAADLTVGGYGRLEIGALQYLNDGVVLEFSVDFETLLGDPTAR